MKAVENAGFQKLKTHEWFKNQAIIIEDRAREIFR